MFATSPRAARADGWTGRNPSTSFSIASFSFSSNSGRFGSAALVVVAVSSSPPSNSPRWPLLRSASTAAPLCIARSIAAISCDRFAPSASNAPAFTSVSMAARPQACGSTRSQKLNRLVNAPSCRRAAEIASAAPLPQPLIALRPNKISSPATAKSTSDRFTSGGTTSTSIRSQSSRCSTSGSLLLKLRPGMSPESSAAMNSTG